MRLWPKDKRDLVLIVLLLWIPVAFSFLIGTQGARSSEAAYPVIVMVAAVTLALLIAAVFTVQRKTK
jgi:hypothetical protein